MCTVPNRAVLYPLAEDTKLIPLFPCNSLVLISLVFSPKHKLPFLKSPSFSIVLALKDSFQTQLFQEYIPNSQKKFFSLLRFFFFLVLFVFHIWQLSPYVFLALLVTANFISFFFGHICGLRKFLGQDQNCARAAT